VERVAELVEERTARGRRDELGQAGGLFLGERDRGIGGVALQMLKRSCEGRSSLAK
jgi:hypothetical protein